MRLAPRLEIRGQGMESRGQCPCAPYGPAAAARTAGKSLRCQNTITQREWCPHPPWMVTIQGAIKLLNKMIESDIDRARKKSDIAMRWWFWWNHVDQLWWGKKKNIIRGSTNGIFDTIVNHLQLICTIFFFLPQPMTWVVLNRHRIWCSSLGHAIFVLLVSCSIQ